MTVAQVLEEPVPSGKHVLAERALDLESFVGQGLNRDSCGRCVATAAIHEPMLLQLLVDTVACLHWLACVVVDKLACKKGQISGF